MAYNPNSPSNWSWSRAFAEMEKTVKQAELTLSKLLITYTTMMVV